MEIKNALKRIGIARARLAASGGGRGLSQTLIRYLNVVFDVLGIARPLTQDELTAFVRTLSAEQIIELLGDKADGVVASYMRQRCLVRVVCGDADPMPMLALVDDAINSGKEDTQ